MREKESEVRIERMSDSERITIAGRMTDAMLNEILGLIHLHANNKILTYSSRITDQIPRSYAANAFNIVQISLFYSELVWICKFWDRIDIDKHSIPTVVKLIEKDSILNELNIRISSNWGGLHFDPSLSNEENDSNIRNEKAFGKKIGDRTTRRMKKTISLSHKIMQSTQLDSIRNTRDKAVHMLEVTAREKKQGAVQPMKYGYESSILARTRFIIDTFHLGINQTSFAWNDSIKFSKRCAEQLWHNCKFTAP